MYGHLNLLEHIKKINHLDKPYKGIVVENNDPDKLYKIKVKIENFLEGDIDKLPWVLPKTPISAFSGGFINVPEKNTEVWITFPFKDNPYILFYDGYWTSKKNSLAFGSNKGIDIFQANYPNVMGWHDSLGNFFAVDKTDETITLNHKTGTQYKINKEGDLNIIGKRDVNINVTRDMNITVDGKIVSHSKGTTEIISDQKVILNMDILPSARKTDEIQYICPIFGVPGKGIITSGNDKVKENI
jgi:hypothetical protein